MNDNINLLSSDYTSNFKMDTLGWWNFFYVELSKIYRLEDTIYN